MKFFYHLLCKKGVQILKYLNQCPDAPMFLLPVPWYGGISVSSHKSQILEQRSYLIDIVMSEGYDGVFFEEKGSKW